MGCPDKSSVFWLAIVVLIGLAAIFSVPKPPCFAKTEDLVALSQQNQLKGGGFWFFIGTAHIEGKEYFYYYSGSEKDGYKLNKISNSGNDVLIKEGTATDSAKVVIDKCGYPDKYTFYIPEGSIIRDFTLDLPKNN